MRWLQPGVDGEPAVSVKANIQGNANGKIESKANEEVPPPKPPANAVILPPPKPLASAVYAPIFVGGVSSAKDVDLQNLFRDTKAIHWTLL